MLATDLSAALVSLPTRLTTEWYGTILYRKTRDASILAHPTQNMTKFPDKTSQEVRMHNITIHVLSTMKQNRENGKKYSLKAWNKLRNSLLILIHCR